MVPEKLLTKWSFGNIRRTRITHYCNNLHPCIVDGDLPTLSPVVTAISIKYEITVEDVVASKHDPLSDCRETFVPLFSAQTSIFLV